MALTVEDFEEVVDVHGDSDVGLVGGVALADGAGAVLEVDEVLALVYIRIKIH